MKNVKGLRSVFPWLPTYKGFEDDGKFPKNMAFHYINLTFDDIW